MTPEDQADFRELAAIIDKHAADAEAGLIPHPSEVDAVVRRLVLRGHRVEPFVREYMKLKFGFDPRTEGT